MNTIYPTAEEILYHDFPLYYCWIKKTERWKRRILSNALKQKQMDYARKENIPLRYNQPSKKNTIGRLHGVPLQNSEAVALRTLLL